MSSLQISGLIVVLLTWMTTTARAFSITGSQGNIQPWSSVAEVNEDDSIRCRDCISQVATVDSRDFDLTSPREWMEFVEATEGKGGAYTVLRCDVKKNNWKVWGRAFHLDRLCQSYCALVDSHVDEEQLNKAVDTANTILDTLLEQASLVLNKGAGDDMLFTAMLTILWQQGTDAAPICVRGHAFCSGKPARISADTCIPDAVTVALALSVDDEELPNRYSNHPEAKLSSWCRRRRPLEQEFKLNSNAGEVLLTRKNGDEVCILEGLTSNVFSLYPNKKLRTADNGVLKGYARKLVLDCAAELGLQYDPTPIRVQDANLWQEVFLTTSIRLVVPVKQILIPIEPGKFHSLWSADGNEFPFSTMLYQQLLEDE